MAMNGCSLVFEYEENAMSQEDDSYRKGLLGLPSGDRGTDYMNGIAEREKRERERRDSYVSKPEPGSGFTGTSFTSGPSWEPDVGAFNGRRNQIAQPPETLISMAKAGASLFAALFVVYTLLQDRWSWPEMIGGSIGLAVVGAIAGAALFIALKILAFAVKIAFFLLIIGVCLHFLGVLNIWTVLSRIMHTIGM
jgi:hypothetical protein